MGTDADACADDGVGRNHRAGLDARLIQNGRRGEEFRDFREGVAGGIDDDAGEGKPGRVFGRNEDGGGLTFAGEPLVLGVAKKGNLAGLGGAKGIDTGNDGVSAVTDKGAADEGGERA